MKRSTTVTVYGASGHTGRFVVDELLRRTLTPVLAGRNADRLAETAARHPELEHRVVGLDDPEDLQQAIDGSNVIINCAGPFLDTALPLATAAVAAGAHYVDVTAEQTAVQRLYRELDGDARDAGVAVVPAMAFYGGLADLVVTAALDGASSADEVEIGIALNRWWPTPGTSATGRRNTATRLVLREGRLAPLADPAPARRWMYPPPFGDQPVVELPFSEVIVIDRHLAIGELRSYLNIAPLHDLRDPATPPPTAIDEMGRSAQRFVMDVAVRQGTTLRRSSVSGGDIYAVTAPIVVEAVARLLAGRFSGHGAVAPGAIFDASDVLSTLARHPGGMTWVTDRTTGRG